MAPMFLSLLLLPLISVFGDAGRVPDERFTGDVDPSPNFTYLGCYTDSVASRTLPGPILNDVNLTGEICTSFCNNKGFVLAGTKFSVCYCGNSLGPIATNISELECSLPCAGNANQRCGGLTQLSVFKKGKPLPPAPIANPGPLGFLSLGCWGGNGANHPLGVAVPVPGGPEALSVNICTSACNGYNYAGVKNKGECYCGNALPSGAFAASDGCTLPCNGNSSEFCGGIDRMNLYGRIFKISATQSLVPTTVSPTPSAAAPNVSAPEAIMPKATNTKAANSSSPVLLTTTIAKSTSPLGVAVDGTLPKATIANNSASKVTTISILAPKATALNGTIPSGSAANSMASLGGTFANSNIPKPTSSNAAPPKATALSPPSGWSYKGCYVDAANGRIFNTQQPDLSTLTVESCISTCAGLGYSVAGMEYGVQCFCDNFVRNGGALTQDADCGMNCGGDSTEKCGAGDRLSVYSNTTIQVYQPPTAQKTDLPGKWSYAGCMSDVAGASTRTLLYNTVMEQNNTAAACLSLCSQFRYNAAGMEFGQECWCGDIANVAPNGGKLAAESECNMACSGNATQICGGGNRLSYYTWNSAPEEALYEWQFPTGAAAGQYQFYVPGVVVPLVTALGVNGKITFLEKFGTGAPNTTGAYELDPSIVDSGGNWSTAWRPMHVSSDIFCSASLTLPDKAGRQIHIGGWALGSTFGIRIYWPDGSPGQPSVNDWQESYPAVKLQNGRWYPTAMIMSNGSILVVGGQDGSNGKAVPTLELLPPVGPNLTLPFLQRTDPYNLYPFTAVLPSGGIFIAYYNEALIMDEVTFATSKTLPNMPGAVNNFLGGRTYPFEGTMILLPQSAPYTDPLSVLICGGTVPGPEFALDNCVSTQPELPKPQWIIERMPSQRVISCMTALPDGTYLILNGAQQGRAGFGLANNPNLNAVFYDPFKPVHHRMSIMANTTVARLYHSEAILMQDGRVLVSGSDPQENTGAKYPEEFRVEVFVPPYILSGSPRPSFTITNKDWSYSASITIRLTSFSSRANIKISLTGAEASTHGNSMGQRTIFPKFSCVRRTCTIVAPPNSRVCPPGWFQLWVLDNGIPSLSQFVRIGGDPARLGEWPAVGGFKLPGV